MNGVKGCTKCGLQKSLAEFYQSKVLKSGYRSRCIACELEGAAEKTKAWYEKNKGRAAASRKRYATENAEKVRDSKKRWSAENRDRINEGNRRYRTTNKDAVNFRAREREKANPEPRKIARKKWDENNPEVRRSITRNRRARIKGVGGKISAAQIVELLDKQSYRCAACRCDTRKTGHHVDHIVPIASGGENTISNAQVLCPPCNRMKSAKDPVEFMQSIGFLL